MSTIMNETMIISTPQQDSSTPQNEVEFIKCECCGLTEECTLAYIERIKEGYKGKWVCGLCSQAVENEVVRSEKLISTEEALNRLHSVCSSFKSLSPPAGGDPNTHLITAMRSILRRSLECHRGGSRSTPASPNRESLGGRMGALGGLARSESCFADL